MNMMMIKNADGLIEISVVDIEEGMGETGEVDSHEAEMVERIPPK